jgi:dTDP-4-amino-4,6-dideoxygalactose transaminase
MTPLKIPFNRPHLTGRELHYIGEAHCGNRLAGDGPFTAKCERWLEEKTSSARALLTHSCTAALEMAALLLDLKPGDEVIMPSYTFVSTANAFVLRRAVPVFVDIREDTLNLDEEAIEAVITARTRAVVPVHYAGVACEMDAIVAIANAYGLSVVEDAAQGQMASYKGRALGGIGALGAFSFHETKNIISGEGGCLFVNDTALVERAEILREKGTDRSRFYRGQVDKYTWQDVGSSFLPGELVAAFLWAQLEGAADITARRLAIWNSYHEALRPLAEPGLIKQPFIPPDCEHNGHMYYVVLANGIDRSTVLDSLSSSGINSVFHYVPLHSSPAGRRFGRTAGKLPVTEAISQQLIRLPLWVEMTESDVGRVVEALNDAITCAIAANKRKIA